MKRPDISERMKGTTHRRKFDKPLVPYNVKVQEETIAMVKELQAALGLTSQGEVITMAVKLLRS